MLSGILKSDETGPRVLPSPAECSPGRRAAARDPLNGHRPNAHQPRALRLLPGNEPERLRLHVRLEP